VHPRFKFCRLMGISVGQEQSKKTHRTGFGCFIGRGPSRLENVSVDSRSPFACSILLANTQKEVTIGCAGYELTEDHEIQNLGVGNRGNRELQGLFNGLAQNF
jgi:hypothetical protein